jgi:flagellar biosynthesis/type III secretory pathway protein FliH
MIQNAIQYGYEEGFRSGQADRNDGWGFDYSSSYGYQDASFGYDSYYVGMDEYSYYFREGFQRGYEDGYYGRYQYGRYSGGKYQILGNVLSTIFNFILD